MIAYYFLISVALISAGNFLVTKHNTADLSKRSGDSECDNFEFEIRNVLTEDTL